MPNEVKEGVIVQTDHATDVKTTRETDRADQGGRSVRPVETSVEILQKQGVTTLQHNEKQGPMNNPTFGQKKEKPKKTTTSGS